MIVPKEVLDFILGMGNRRMVIEVGAGKKDYRQVIQTAKKIDPAYSLIISDDSLSYSKRI